MKSLGRPRQDDLLVKVKNLWMLGLLHFLFGPAAGCPPSA
jgi:hypothetical protein